MKSKKYNIYQRNPKKIYNGSHYAITGSGGYSIQESYAMKLSPIQQLGKYDMTDAVQILFPACLLNEFLGDFNAVTNQFNNNQIIITAEQFLYTVREDDILSVGEFGFMYADYRSYVNNYFGHTMNTYSLFTNDSQREFNNGIFDKNCLYSTLREKTTGAFGEIKEALNGYIEINKVSEMLLKITELNLFGNRSFLSGTQDIYNGFIDGDLIYIPDGIHIKLDTKMTLDLAVLPIIENEFNIMNETPTITLDKEYQSALLLRVI
jgi:hypothetical protein